MSKKPATFAGFFSPSKNGSLDQNICNQYGAAAKHFHRSNIESKCSRSLKKSGHYSIQRTIH